MTRVWLCADDMRLSDSLVTLWRDRLYSGFCDGPKLHDTLLSRLPIGTV